MKNKVFYFLIMTCLLSMGNRCSKDEKRWVPVYYVGDPLRDQIINKNNEVVSCQEEAFLDYGCLHIDKINELRRILKKRCK